jgi:arabinan endo-1,5-alpha-L-arabinosidase
LELAVEGAPVGGRRGAPRGGGAGGRGGNAAPGRGDAAPPSPIPAQEAAQVSANWPAAAIDARLSPYLVQAQQKWSISPVANAGGYPGSPYFRISVAGTERSLAATSEGELTVVPAFNGGPEQLWRIDQLADGAYRLMPKAVPGANAPMALSAIGGSSPTLERVDAATDRQRWLLRTP